MMLASRFLRVALPLVLLSLTVFAVADVPSTRPTLPATAPSGIDAALWTRMIQIDARAGNLTDLSADFEQKKFTPLLKKPMISTGSVWARGSVMLWDTRSPEPSVMRVDDKEVGLYYPKQKTVELYPIAGQLSALAASPLPRLAVLLPHFNFALATDKDLKDLGDINPASSLVLRLSPIDDALKEHIDHVVVLIDAGQGFILGLKIVDSDGERTVIRFSNTKVSAGFDDARLKLQMPADVKVVRPLENLGSAPRPPIGKDPKPSK